MRLSVVSAYQALPVTMASGASVSDSVDLGGLRLFGVDMPAAWTDASLTLQAMGDDGVWRDVKDENGTEIVLSAAANDALRLRNPSLFAALQKIRLRSGLSAAPVTQSATRSIYLILRGI